MTVKLIRVDDRLIHGQVAVGWTRSLGVDHIVVADDKVAGDAMQKTLMKMAAPTGVGVTFTPVPDAPARVAELAGQAVLVLVRGPVELAAVRAAGLPMTSVNVGNVHSGPGRTKLTREVYASPEELEIWRGLAADGIELKAQWLPDQGVTDLRSVIGQ
ncbi:PTS system mannose/fructose/N-acetylgalactosamine-transporter subunit IIB [Streptomyces sp. MAR4 CNX-425]|uniref:PTS system mannose/fructose/N-acetylgalactosamine-transporter subunit IIB n=1 Tax=Streptomyces sp. MAR4 CNX-425 TaxID=3406343 RepID=UPI003B50C758